MLTEAQLIERIHQLCQERKQFISLVKRRQYLPLYLDENDGRLAIRFQNGKVRKARVRDIFALYRELYRLRCLPRNYMRNPNNAKRVVGRSHWHAPGAAIYAIIPHLDTDIKVADGGHLYMKALK